MNIYDFGYIFNLKEEEFNLIERIIHNPHKLEYLDNFLFFYLNKEYNNHLNNDTIYEQYKNIIHKYIESLSIVDMQDIIHQLFRFIIDSHIFVSNECLNCLIIFLQLINIYNSGEFCINDNSADAKIYKGIINICECYGECSKLLHYLEDKVNQNTNFKRLTKYNNLQKFLI